MMVRAENTFTAHAHTHEPGAVQPLLIHTLASDVTPAIHCLSAKAKPGVAVEIHKKSKSSIRHWFFSSK